MGQISKETYDTWGDGCITSLEADALPPAAFPHGLNCALTSIGAGKAVVMKRRGCKILNTTAITGASAVIGQHAYRRLSGSTLLQTHLAISDTGRLDSVSTAGVVSTIASSAFTASTTQTYLPDFADANNLCFMVNGQEAKKYDGTSLTPFGITAPTTAPTLTDSGVAGSPNGTYEARVTFANSATGEESSAGVTSATVSVASKKIDWSAIPVSSDSQVDTRYLYIRNTTTMANFYRAATLTDNTTTTAQTNNLDSALATVGPDTAENNPPPTGVKYLAWHRSRMFAATDTDLFYSKIELPEAFDPDNFEPVNPDDGQKITGIISVFDILVVLKSKAMYALVGDDPFSWTMRLIDSSIGCVSHRSILSAGGKVYWWSEQGPVVWDGQGTPDLLGPPFLGQTITTGVLSFDDTYIAKICAAHDITNQRVLWAVPDFGQIRNTRILPFNYRIQRWESDGWDPMDVASFASVEDTTGRPFIMLGGYSGQIFRWWDAPNDGVRPGTTASGTFTAAGTSVTTLTDLTASFDMTGGGLVERKVTIVDSTGAQVGSIRPRVTANTSTALTLSVPVQGLTVAATYTYYIGGPAFDWSSAWLTAQDAFFKKRYQFLFMQCRSMASTVGIKIDMYFSYAKASSLSRTQTFTATSGLGTWDASLWDTALWDAAGQVTKRFRVGRTGTACQVRLRHYAPDSDVVLLKIGLTTEALSDRLG